MVKQEIYLMFSAQNVLSFAQESLFTSSHERKYAGFVLLEAVLPSLTVREVPLVFSPNLLRCLINNASSEDNYLHAAATHLVLRV